MTGPGRLRTTAITSANTSTIASAISISLTLSQNPATTLEKLSLKPLSEKNASMNASRARRERHQ